MIRARARTVKQKGYSCLTILALSSCNTIIPRLASIPRCFPQAESCWFASWPGRPPSCSARCQRMRPAATTFSSTPLARPLTRHPRRASPAGAPRVRERPRVLLPPRRPRSQPRQARNGPWPRHHHPCPARRAAASPDPSSRPSPPLAARRSSTRRGDTADRVRSRGVLNMAAGPRPGCVGTRCARPDRPHLIRRRIPKGRS